MATIHIELSTVQGRALTGATVLVPDSVEAGADTKTTAGTTALSDLTGQPGQFWTVTVNGGNVFLKFGAGTPTAVSDSGRRLLDGMTRDFAVTVANEKLAFIDG